MSTSTRKTSRSTAALNTSKSTGNSRALASGPSNRKTSNLVIDGESKLAPRHLSASPVGDLQLINTSKKNSISENISITLHGKFEHDESGVNHLRCNETISQLEEQIKSLTKEKSELKIDLKVVSAELSLEKDEKRMIKNEYNSLLNINEELEKANSVLRNDFEKLSDELARMEEKWKNERDVLEKALNEIRKELEAKIIEIRAKHQEEILDFEEKNRILKVRLSNNLQVNSWERQQEIDRITSELEKSLANEESLKLQLTRIIPHINGGPLYCQKCQTDLAADLKTGLKDMQTNIVTPADIKRGNREKMRKHRSADINR